ncbi:GIY-YIG nuclease family protein [Methanosphaerula subterraneus]|uniref:GIY-YIG nuclease family protein n=1 Tax=Methanosphaerula subterraneus TaxID=3350244 RepID=UPI003F83E1DB
MAGKGIYCLCLRNSLTSLSIGRLGERTFEEGWHLYVGSALGPGGLARADRHQRLAAARDRRPTWHIDHLLISDRFRLAAVITAETTDPLECALAAAIGGRSVQEFGSSDCHCGSHLFYRPSDPAGEVCTAMEGLGLAPAIRRVI